MQHRRMILRGCVVAGALLVVGCGGGGGTAASTSSSSTSSSSSSVSAKVKDAYETALSDLGSAFNDSADARSDVTDVPGINAAQPLLRNLRDAWFNFDKHVRDIDFPSKFQVKVNAVLTANGTVIADLDKFTDVLRPEEFNATLATLDQDVEAFRKQADLVARDLGVQGTHDTSSTTSSSSSSRSSASSSAAAAITDATSTRDQLVQLAQQSGSVDVSAEPAITTWSKALPGVDFVGSAVPASPTQVSGFTPVTSKSKDTDFLAFAVQDGTGACAGAVLEFNPTDTAVTGATTLDDVTGECTGDTVSEALGF